MFGRHIHSADIITTHLMGGRFQGEKLEVGDKILSVGGELATPQNINDLLSGSGSADVLQEVNLQLSASRHLSKYICIQTYIQIMPICHMRTFQHS